MDVIDGLRESGVVAVMRGAESNTVVEVARALREGGVTALELTMDAPDAASMLGMVADAVDDGLVGAGTVMDAATAEAAIDAGASFVVSPHFEPEVVETCVARDVFVAPGVLTPTEAVRADRAGADMCKVFPASTVGPGHLAALKGPLPHIPLMPTGGVDLANAGAFVRAGAECVGVGSALVDDEAVARGEFGVLTETAEAFVAEVAAARSETG